MFSYLGWHTMIRHRFPHARAVSLERVEGVVGRLTHQPIKRLPPYNARPHLEPTAAEIFDSLSPVGQNALIEAKGLWNEADAIGRRLKAA